MTTVERLVGVYDADHTLWGELRYWVGARLGRAHCALCDITHGTFREREEWRSCRDALPVPFDTFHRDDQPPDVAAVVGGRLPAVVARTPDGGVVALLDAGSLTSCDGRPPALVAAIEAAVARQGLAWPGST